MPEISVIVPVYNAENYLDSCIESILIQVNNFEIILIDDGSTDNSPSICDLWNTRDCRIKVIHKKNGGVSSARNAGLDIAKGEWIVFVDVDDILKQDALEFMLSHLDAETDILFAGFEIYKDGKIVNKIPSDCKKKLSNINLAKELFAPSDYHYQGFTWSKLYKRSIIEANHIRFNETIKYNEDRLFTFAFLSHACKGVYTTKPIYEYYLHGGSAMAAIEGPNYWKFETDLDAFVEMNRIAPSFNSPGLVKLVRYGTISSYNWNRRLNKVHGNNNEHTNRRLKKKLLSVVPRSFLLEVSCRNNYNRLKARLYLFVIKIRNK